jgi:hypothetical protein
VSRAKLRPRAEQLIQRDVRTALEDRPGDEAVRFAMHRLQSLLVKHLGEATHRTVWWDRTSTRGNARRASLGLRRPGCARRRPPPGVSPGASWRSKYWGTAKTYVPHSHWPSTLRKRRAADPSRHRPSFAALRTRPTCRSVRACRMARLVMFGVRAMRVSDATSGTAKTVRLRWPGSRRGRSAGSRRLVR